MMMIMMLWSLCKRTRIRKSSVLWKGRLPPKGFLITTESDIIDRNTGQIVHDQTRVLPHAGYHLDLFVPTVKQNRLMRMLGYIMFNGILQFSKESFSRFLKSNKKYND